MKTEQVNEDKDLGNESADRKTDCRVLRELDAEVHVKVMGHPLESTLIGDGETLETALRLEPDNAAWRVRSAKDNYWHRWSPNGAERIVIAPHYSTDIAAAMSVAEKIGFDVNDLMKSINMSAFSIHRYPDGQWLAHFSLKGKAYAPTLPEAICRAALKAVECLSISDRRNDGQAS